MLWISTFLIASEVELKKSCDLFAIYLLINKANMAQNIPNMAENNKSQMVPMILIFLVRRRSKKIMSP